MEDKISKMREKNLREKLIKFASKYEKIKAVTKGIDPEKGREVYYFIIKPPYDSKLQDEISGLEKELKTYKCHLLDWPAEYNNIKTYLHNHAFLGEIFWESNNRNHIY